uniref:Reverse transcriptase domain-containing protein n=1 Tax=Tanacetum cinerariifolium TaxID=118510 RepID=A0A6L2KFS8_TANCI|nr:hypothetical protein [Tanacetum cinerariifolium]
MAQNIDFSDSDQSQTPQYPDVHLPSQEMNEKVSQAEGELMKSIQTFLETFICIPFEEKPKILFQAWEIFEGAGRYDNSPSKDRPIFLNNNEEHYVQNEESLENSSNEIATSNSNQEKEEPSQESDIHQLIEECSIEVSEDQKQSMEDTMLELVKICQEKEFLCIHDNVDDLIESALNTKLLSINYQPLEKEQQEVKNVVEQPAKLAPILSTKEPEHSTSMGYEHSNTTLKTELDEIIKSDSSASDVCDDHSEIFSDSNNDDDISVYDDFEDIEYVEASLFDPEIVNQEEEEVDLEDISQIQDMRSGNTTHADNSLPEYDSFCFEIEPDQERLINVVKSNISDDSSNGPLLEEANLFLAFDNSIPSSIENVADDSEGDIRFLEELLIDDSILSHESSESNIEDNP